MAFLSSVVSRPWNDPRMQPNHTPASTSGQTAPPPSPMNAYAPQPNPPQRATPNFTAAQPYGREMKIGDPVQYSPGLNNVRRGPYAPPAASAQQQAPRPSNSAFADAWNVSMKGNTAAQPARTFGGGGLGNLAYMPDSARPAPFTSHSIGPDGRQVSQRESLNNRDAFISALIQDNARHAARSGVYQGQGNPPPGFMAPPPPPNFAALWGGAQNAVNNGWRSPVSGLWG